MPALPLSLRPMYELAWSSNSAILEGKWSPICLSRSGPPISHLFFADDLVIFSKADAKHCKLIKAVLDSFCDFFGHKINSRKTNIFFSKGVDEMVADSISFWFGFQKVQNLGCYLGVPLFHKRVTNSTMHFVVEKVRGKLQSWEAKGLFIAVTDKEALWVWVIRAKYRMEGILLNSIRRDRSSFLWKSLTKIWSLLRENLCWSVGNGCQIRCWEDVWIPSVGQLIKFIPATVNFDSGYCLKDMVNEDGS
ncbi:Retrovirus-related Pol polyprotein LINE-1 [Gossypium australe]|uniref:Retrovirus-related Pol polyprotein LINE-1 n=1 Tax=Gossypium australe TaxID=47621 RepID=A0A5B6WVF7_9ROSI|nr:Retrovirus-related Pol polyprotein LINE-1 [Gossypium australe]